MIRAKIFYPGCVTGRIELIGAVPPVEAMVVLCPGGGFDEEHLLVSRVRYVINPGQYDVIIHLKACV